MYNSAVPNLPFKPICGCQGKRDMVTSLILKYYVSSSLAYDSCPREYRHTASGLLHRQVSGHQRSTTEMHTPLRAQGYILGPSCLGMDAREAWNRLVMRADPNSATYQHFNFNFNPVIQTFQQR